MAITQEKAEAIANEYIRNGFVKSVALMTVGYSKTYAVSGLGQKLYENIRVKEAIKRKLAELAEELMVTQEIVAKKAEQHRALALAKDDISAANGALTLQAKAFGLLTDKIQTEDLNTKRELDEKYEQEAKRIANIRLREDLKAG